MTRERQWYDDVMAVGLHETLKKAGFRRKSHTNYVCEHSPDRVWVFEIEPRRGRQRFRDWSGIFVPEIEEIVAKIAPEIGTCATFLREPTQFRTSIANLVRIDRGWDEPTWENNPKSRHWLWGRQNPPPVTKAIPLCDGNVTDGWWDPNYASAVLIGSRNPNRAMYRRIGTRSYEQQQRETQEAALAVGSELEKLWREYAYDWLLKCDNTHYLARWFDSYVFSGTQTPLRHTYAATAAVAYHVAGDNEGAANVLRRMITELQTAYEMELAREQARDRPPGPVARLVRRLTSEPIAHPPPKHDAETRARKNVTVEQEYAEAARKIARGLGIKL